MNVCDGYFARLRCPQRAYLADVRSILWNMGSIGARRLSSAEATPPAVLDADASQSNATPNIAAVSTVTHVVMIVLSRRSTSLAALGPPHCCSAQLLPSRATHLSARRWGGRRRSCRAVFGKFFGAEFLNVHSF